MYAFSTIPKAARLHQPCPTPPLQRLLCCRSVHSAQPTLCFAPHRYKSVDFALVRRVAEEVMGRRGLAAQAAARGEAGAGRGPAAGRVRDGDGGGGGEVGGSDAGEEEGNGGADAMEE